ncbi:hypothetical protein LIER_20143 [Lithospermum erythrorhizon]|uniref:Uncharacterized protein n=1 Tax=Lithospermum erythrorhizon TaxID=34254 RepID=A0AAV3QMQ5_LITER
MELTIVANKGEGSTAPVVGPSRAKTKVKGPIDDHRIEKKVAPTPPKGFVPPTSGPKVEYGTIGPKAYDRLVMAGYDPKERKTLGEFPPEVTGDKGHSLNETQKMLQQTGHAIKSPSAGLGYIPKSPIRVLIKRVNNYHISVVEKYSTEDRKTNKQRLVFLRLGAKVKNQDLSKGGLFSTDLESRLPNPIRK